MPDVLGLDRYMHEAYRVLVEERKCTVAEVAGRLGVPLAAAEQAMQGLVGVGLAAPAADLSHAFAPVDPEHTLGELLADRQARLTAEQQELARAKETIASLSTIYAAADDAVGSTDATQVPHGPAAVRARVEDLVASARADVVGVVNGAASSIAFGIRPAVVEASIARGVAVRVLYPVKRATDPAFVAQSRWLAGAGGRPRSCVSPPPAMVVVDRTTTLLPADGGPATALVIHNRPLSRALGMLFDQVWEQAKLPDSARPIYDDGAEPSSAEVDLLRLLGNGMTDASAARQLGVSLRTVRRMMADLMSRLGARSRFEAGMRAVERGWLGTGALFRLEQALPSTPLHAGSSHGGSIQPTSAMSG